MDDYVHEEGGEDNTIWEDDLGSGGWEPIDFASNPVKVSFNKVDEMLLKTLREEAKVIADRVRQILGVPNGRKMRSVPLQRLFNLWFSPDLVHTILLRVNKSFIVEDQVSAAELYAFMQVEMYLSAYNTFPSKFFSNSMRYPEARECLPETRYKAILAAMQKSQNQLSPGVRDGHWIHPYKLDDDVVKISASTKEIGRTIAFVPNITLCCTDDHHEQGRNRAEVEALGFAWINNPKKRVGSVQHTMVSVATDLIVGRDLERLGGSTNASTLRLIVSLGGRDRGDLNVPLNLTNRIDVDRGYR